MAFEDGSSIIKDDVIRILADNFIDINKDVIWVDMSMFDSSKIFSKKHKLFVESHLIHNGYMRLMQTCLWGRKFEFFKKWSLNHDVRHSELYLSHQFNLSYEYLFRREIDSL